MIGSYRRLAFLRILLWTIFIQFPSKAMCVDIYFFGKSKIIEATSIGKKFSITFTAILFEINGNEFEHIDVSNPDVEISRLFEGSSNVNFVIDNVGRLSRNFTPPLRLQQNFIRCVTEGMCSFISINSRPEYARLPNSLLTLKNIGVNHLYPCCTHLTYFLEMGVTKFPTKHRQRRYKVISPHSNVSNYSILELHGSSGVVHEMIYIGNGLGFSKLGDGFLYFHTISSIKRLYEQMVDEELEIREFRYSKDDFDPPPPSAGAAFAT